MRNAWFYALVPLLVLHGYSFNAEANPVNNATINAAAGSVKTISFVVLNDLHANLVEHNDLVRTPTGGVVPIKRGGLARIATLIKQIRVENPSNVVMNIGDTFHGGVEAFYSEGNDIVTVVNALGIDVGVPGNWDYAYGPNVTVKRFTNDRTFIFPRRTILKPNYPNLAANVTKTQGARVGQTLLPPTLMKNINGVDVGFIGISSDIVAGMHPNLGLTMDFLQGENNYRNLINQLAFDLRAGTPAAQIVVVMSELGIHKDKRLADVIDAGLVDVFFSAHTHELITTPLSSVSGALVVEAGDDVYLGRMDVVIAPSGIVSRNWSVIPVDSTIAEDTVVKGLINGVRVKYLDPNVHIVYPGPVSNQTLSEPIDTVIATSSRIIARHHSLENSFNNLMVDLLRSATASQLALTPGFRFDAVVPATGMVFEGGAVATGDITIEDIYRFIPVPYTLSVGSITGGQLKRVIEKTLNEVYSIDEFSHFGGWFDGYSGLIANVNLANADNHRINYLELEGGITINDTDSLSVTGCSRPFDINTQTTLCGRDGFTGVTAITDAAGATITAIDFVINAFKNGDYINMAERQNITDTNATPLWPQGDIFQPIAGVP